MKPLLLRLLLAISAALPWTSPSAQAADVSTPQVGAATMSLPSVADVLKHVNGRSHGKSMSQHIAATLTESDGTVRQRGIRIFRRDIADEAQTVIFFTSPTSLAGTGLLVRDYAEEGRDDGMWLYLPAMRSVRRISSSGRGQRFFDTDFSYVEIATDTRLRTDLLRFEVAAREDLEGMALLKIDATPLDAGLVREMGYERAEYWIDEATWTPRRVLMYGRGSAAPTKEIRFDDLRQVQGYLTVHRRSAVQFGSGHRTTFVSSDLRYDVDLADSLFTESGLSHGPPR